MTSKASLVAGRPWGVIDPNSAHQRWSLWTCDVYELGGKVLAPAYVERAAREFFRMLFGRNGEIRVTRATDTLPTVGTCIRYRIEVRVEGVDAHDPGVVLKVRDQFARHFVERGWGPYATSRVRARLLAGDAQDGRPRAQVIVGDLRVSRKGSI